MTKPCTGRVEIFFSTRPALIERARALCSGCADRVPCAAGAVSRREEAGVWGGMLAEELLDLADQAGDRAGAGHGDRRRPLRAVPGMCLA